MIYASNSIGTKFKGNTSVTCLKELVKFKKISIIESGSFDGCTSLYTVGTENITKINNERAFNECTSLIYIDLSNCTYIGANAFTNCSSLSNIGSLEKVTYIGAYSPFSGCKSLNIELYLPSLTEFKGQAWGAGFTKITNLGSITYLTGTFKNCTSLLTAIIPNTIQTMSGSVFEGCCSLKWIKVLADTPPSLTASYGLSNTNNCTIYVPDDSVSAYQTATNWSTYSSRIKPLSEFTE